MQTMNTAQLRQCLSKGAVAADPRYDRNLFRTVTLSGVTYCTAKQSIVSICFPPYHTYFCVARSMNNRNGAPVPTVYNLCSAPLTALLFGLMVWFSLSAFTRQSEAANGGSNWYDDRTNLLRLDLVPQRQAGPIFSTVTPEFCDASWLEHS